MLWCAAGDDLFAPGLACAGLHPDRVIHAVAPTSRAVLLVMEEALRHPGLSAVVGEVSRLPMTASRRLVLAAERSGVMALALRRRREGRPEETGLTRRHAAGASPRCPRRRCRCRGWGGRAGRSS